MTKLTEQNELPYFLFDKSIIVEEIVEEKKPSKNFKIEFPALTWFKSEFNFIFGMIWLFVTLFVIRGCLSIINESCLMIKNFSGVCGFFVFVPQKELEEKRI